MADKIILNSSYYSSHYFLVFAIYINILYLDSILYSGMSARVNILYYFISFRAIK